MRAGFIILAVLIAETAFAQEVWVPLVQPSDVKVVQVLDDGALLVQSGTYAFVCQSVEQEAAVVFDNCKAVIPQFTYVQLQFEAQARLEDIRLKEMSPDDVDAATRTTLKAAGCVIDVGAFEFFSNDALVAFSSTIGVQSDLAPFLKDTIEGITRESLKRIFVAGEVVFLNNQTKISLKDCA